MAQSATNTPAISATGLGKRFGRQWALAHCDLDIQPGETMLLAGANGSGKTTLLRLLAALYKPTRGQIRIFGHDPEQERLTCRRMLTMVGHDHYLYSQLTALEMVQIWARLGGAEADTEALRSLLDEVDLDRRRNQQVSGFSAGMKKRLTLLRTKLEQPEIVLLDEPFSALDTDGQDLIEAWIHEFKRRGKTVVVASHNLPRAAALCDRAVYLQEGQIVWQGAANGLIDHLGLTS